jgi:broad specificity phosphatase PhoE
MPTDLYLVRHAESCSNLTAGKNTTYRLRHNGILHEPTLSIRGYIQSLLEEYEHRFRENENITDEFREYISRLSNISSILVFTHKRFITRIVPHISNEPKNTSITKLTLDTETQTNIYRPSTMKKHRFTLSRKHQIEQCNAAKSFVTRQTTQQTTRRRRRRKNTRITPP